MEAYFNLPIQEQAQGYNAKLVLNSDDLTEVTVDTAQTFDVAVGDVVAEGKGVRIIKQLKDELDAAHNSVTIDVGDAGDPDSLVDAKQVGSTATGDIVAGVGLPVEYADGTLRVTVTPGVVGKALADIDEGEIEILLNLLD